MNTSHFLCSFCWQPNESPSLNGNTAFTLQNSREKIEQIQVNRSWFECPDYKKSVLVSLKNIWQIFYFLSKISTMYWKYSKKTHLIQFFIPMFRCICTKNVIFHFQWGYKTVKPKRGDWEWLWCHFRTFTFAENRFLSHFLIVSKEIAPRNGTEVCCL